VPHIRLISGNWWCFNSREDSKRQAAGDVKIKAWYGFDPLNAYKSWARFNRMKP
jgi:hypothetical protein